MAIMGAHLIILVKLATRQRLLYVPVASLILLEVGMSKEELFKYLRWVLLAALIWGLFILYLVLTTDNGYQSDGSWKQEINKLREN